MYKYLDLKHIEKMMKNLYSFFISLGYVITFSLIILIVIATTNFATVIKYYSIVNIK